MKERPILFSAPMVRALLDGGKTQTRRIITRGNSYRDGARSSKERWAELNFDSPLIFVDDGPSPAGNPGPYLHVPDHDPDDGVHRVYPQWQLGDRLWVRETWAAFDADWLHPGKPHDLKDGPWPNIAYAADKDLPEGTARPSIHMPRWASRTLLEVVSVRVERLQDISEEDAIAEGIAYDPRRDPVGSCKWASAIDPSTGWSDPVAAYRELIESINGAGTWDANPWVWVVEFKRKL